MIDEKNTLFNPIGNTYVCRDCGAFSVFGEKTIIHFSPCRIGDKLRDTPKSDKYTITKLIEAALYYEKKYGGDCPVFLEGLPDGLKGELNDIHFEPYYNKLVLRSDEMLD